MTIASLYSTGEKMEKQNILTELLKEKETIRMQVATLNEDLEAVNRLLKRFSKNQQIEIQISTQLPQPDALGLTEAIRQLFEQYPEKEWSPAEIRNRLNEMKLRGEINSEAKDFLPSTHLIIKKLINNDFVEKVREQADPTRKWYKRRLTIEERKRVE